MGSYADDGRRYVGVGLESVCKLTGHLFTPYEPFQFWCIRTTYAMLDDEECADLMEQLFSGQEYRSRMVQHANLFRDTGRLVLPERETTEEDLERWGVKNNQPFFEIDFDSELSRLHAKRYRNQATSDSLSSLPTFVRSFVLRFVR